MTVADDITIYIRVRDATRGAISRVSRDLGRLQTRLRAAGNNRNNIFDRLGDSLRRTQDHLRRSTAFVGRFRGALNRIGASGLTPLIRLSDAMGNRMRRVFRDASGWVGTFRGHLSRVGPMFTRIGNGVRSFANRIERASRLTKILLVVIALLGPAAQVAGALLIGALGLSFVALGAFALRGSAQVKSAFQAMKSTIGSTVREAAKPMEGALVAGMQQLAQAARVLQPLLTQAFAATGPLIKSVAGAITDFGAGALPGMVAALQHAGPAMAGFRQAMGQIGQGFGDMFKKMTVGNEQGLANAWKLIGSELDNFLSNLGEFIGELTSSASATTLLLGVLRSFSGILHIVEAAFKAIDEVASPLFQKINGWVQGMSGLSGVSKQVAASFSYVGMSSSQLHDKLDAVNKKIHDIQEGFSGVKGPAKKGLMDKQGYSKLVSEREALEAALAAAAGTATNANKNETKSVKDLMDAMRQLNENNRNNLDARANMEQAIDDAQKGYKKYADALKMTHGQLDLTNKSGREAYDYLSKIAAATNDATQKAEEAKAPWATVQAEWKRGRDSVIALAHGMGLSKAEARALADQIIRMPDKTAKVKGDIADLEAKIKAAKGKLSRVPDSRKSKVRADIAQLESALAIARNDLARLNGQTATVRIMTEYFTAKSPAQLAAAHGRAHGGLAPGYAGGGQVLQTHPNGGLIRGPGSGTSDSILEMSPNGGMYRTSDREFILQSSAVRKYGVGFLNALNAGRLRLAGYKKGGLTQAQKNERDARSQMSGQFGISYFGKIAGYKHTPYEVATARPDSLGSLVSSLNELRGEIKRAFHGKQESGLLRQLTNAGKSLIKYEKKLTDVNKKLDAAKTKLNDLKQAASSLRDQVKSGVMSATDITRVAGNDKNVTMTDIMATMRESVDKSSAFSGALKSLQSRGVSKDIINQIAEAGISGGGLETAGALLSASDSEIAQINAMQKQINDNAKSAGKTAADSMYAAGIKAADGLVKGLTKKKKDIEDAMMKIAKSMEKAIKKALGIKSPSRVMMNIGHHTAEGFALGMQKNKRVPNAWESMLNVPRGASAGSAAGGDGIYSFPIYVGGKFLDEVILDTNRRLVRTRGGDVQKVFGRR